MGVIGWENWLDGVNTAIENTVRSVDLKRDKWYEESTARRHKVFTKPYPSPDPYRGLASNQKLV